MKIRTKLKATPLLLVLFALFMGMVFLFMSNRLQQMRDLDSATNEIARGVFELNILTYEYLNHPSDRPRLQWHSRHDTLVKFVTSTRFTNAEDQEVLVRISQNLQDIAPIFSDIVTTERIVNPTAEEDVSGRLRDRLVNNLLMTSQSIISDSLRLNQQYHDSVVNLQNRLIGIIVAAMFLLTFSLITITISLNRTIMNSITLLLQAAETVGAGNLQYRISYNYSDEIKQVAESFNRMTAQLQSSYDAIGRECELRHEKAILLEEEIAQRQRVEEQLHMKSRELEKLNLGLEQRVQEEVAQNIEKDRMMLHQARQAAMGEMLSNIAHQWRQPLNNIALLIQGCRIELEDGSLDRPSFDRHVQQTMEILKNLSKTIDNFRTYYSARQEQSSFHLDECVKRTLAVVQSALEASCIRVELANLPECVIKGSNNELSQALLNIIANARDILLKRTVVLPCITISGSCDSASVTMSIADNGGGVPDNIIDRIFEPYFTTKFKSPGTGIGLYMAKMIIEKGLQGTISVTNSAEGAIFNINIPVCSEET